VWLVLGLAVLAACGGDGGPQLHDRLLLVRNEGIAELALGSGEERLLLSSPQEALLIEPSISPDGSTIAYTLQLIPTVVPGRPVELGMDLWLADRDGSNSRLLLEHEMPNSQFRSPVWLPDGAHMLIGTGALEGAMIRTTIELLDLASGERTVVVENGFRPGVSPDGTRLVFVRMDEMTFVQSLWIANIDGSDERMIAGPGDGLGSFTSPRFSPDGATIAFAASEPLQQQVAAGEGVRFAGADGAALRGAAVAFNGLPMDLWTIAADGSDLRKIAELKLDLPGLAWSGDGARLFVLSGLGLFVVAPDGSSHRQIGDGTFHGQVDWLGAGGPTAQP
jgi:Tol biopolymer transport system component